LAAFQERIKTNGNEKKKELSFGRAKRELTGKSPQSSLGERFCECSGRSIRKKYRYRLKYRSNKRVGSNRRTTLAELIESLRWWAGLPDGLFSNQKSQIWVNFGGPLNGKCWYIL
jgi:hypothetical protein